MPADGDCVVLRYVGWSSSGAVVESSYGSGLDGIPCRMSDLSARLASGVRTMTVGEKRRFWLPEAPGGASPAAPAYTVFDVELVDLLPSQRPC